MTYKIVNATLQTIDEKLRYKKMPKYCRILKELVMFPKIEILSVKSVNFKHF